MQTLFNYLVNEFIIWGIILVVAFSLAKAISKGETGRIVLTLILGVFAYYFAKNPQTVLSWGANILSKLFGG